MEELNRAFEVVASYFVVMSEPVRLKIVHALCHEEKSVSHIVREVGASQTNVSRHLGLMYRAGAVAKRRKGNQVFYRIVDGALVDICRTACIEIASRLDSRQPLRENLVRILPPPRQRR